MSSISSSNTGSFVIKAEFSIPPRTFDYESDMNVDQHIQTFDTTNCVPARFGLQEDGKDPMKPKAGDYKYSGMHDSGPILPKPKEYDSSKTGESMDGYAILLDSINKAQQESNRFLTGIIEKEREQGRKKQNTKSDKEEKKRQRED